MWLLLAFLSASLLGLYDVAKKQAVTANAVLPVLLLTTLFSSLLFVPMILSAEFDLGWFDGGIFEGERGDLMAHGMVFIKAIIVLTSWILGYFAIKHLPLTTVGPINATRPVMTLIGAMLIFGERLNAWQWSGVLLSLLSIFLLSRSSKREGINFASNVWILMLAGAAASGAMSGLYDKFIMQTLNPIFVQGWYNLYQLLLMSLVVGLIWYPKRNSTTPFHWSWAIPLISIFLSMADMAYFFALEQEEAMISVVSMVRRSSVIVSFAFGALIFGEKNLRAKALDLVFILIGMILLYIGTQC
ncbi:MAG: EamA family transporter [Rikenellaceae bacterium]